MNFRFSYLYLTMISLGLHGLLWFSYFFAPPALTMYRLLWISISAIIIELTFLFIMQMFSFGEENSWKIPYLFHTLLHLAGLANAGFFIYLIWQQVGGF